AETVSRAFGKSTRRLAQIQKKVRHHGALAQLPPGIIVAVAERQDAAIAEVAVKFERRERQRLECRHERAFALGRKDGIAVAEAGGWEEFAHYMTRADRC